MLAIDPPGARGVMGCHAGGHQGSVVVEGKLAGVDGHPGKIVGATVGVFELRHIEHPIVLGAQEEGVVVVAPPIAAHAIA